MADVVWAWPVFIAPPLTHPTPPTREKNTESKLKHCVARRRGRSYTFKNLELVVARTADESRPAPQQTNKQTCSLEGHPERGTEQVLVFENFQGDKNPRREAFIRRGRPVKRFPDDFLPPPVPRPDRPTADTRENVPAAS